MTKDELLQLKSWFDVYTEGYLSGSSEFVKSVKVKTCHIRRVVKEIAGIAASLQLDKEMSNTAEASGLLHDIGRFEQYRKYGTYSDTNSENHASLGVQVIKEWDILSGISPAERILIEDAVYFHNQISLPQDKTPEGIRLMRMVRDADKLDIWNVVIEHYARPDDEESCIILGFPETDRVSEVVCGAILSGELALFKDLQSVNDFKLMQLGWIYDVNFPHTFREIKKRGYLKNIRDTLPQTDVIDRIYNKVNMALHAAC